jgi:aspartyl-tRNA synthetase
VIFIDLRDREGITQVVIPRTRMKCTARRTGAPGYVIAVEGKVALRGADTVNPNLATGEVEVVAQRIWILNESRTPPFPMEETVDVSRRRAPEIPLRRSAPPAHAAQHHPALEDRLRRARVLTARAFSKSKRPS